MSYPYILRVCHFIKTIFRVNSQSFFGILNNILCAFTLVISMCICAPSYAESNVMGEEIIIYADDADKATPKDLANKNPNAQDISNDNFSIDNSFSKKLGDSRLSNSPENNIFTDNGSETDVINTVNDDLWQRIKDGYAIPNSTSGLIVKHESWYSSRPDYMKRMVERSQKYLFHIVEEVEKRGMPTEIALLPMIESAYNPQAYSTSRASGIWQFIPSTGKSFGLKQNWWVDNRRNVTAATDAALTYLQKLHGMFGAWDLALAAYNAGEGTVGRAIARNRKLGLATDYESLSLSAETKNYVPKLQAIKNLMTNPNNYGLKIQTIANSAYFTKVSAPTQIDAQLAAKLAGISDDEFLALNPSYNRPVITSSSDKHELLLPIAAAETFKSNLASYDKPLVSWKTYHAKRGERIDNIANKFGIQLAQLRTVNNLPEQKKIKTASTILVPNGHRTDFNSAEIASDKIAQVIESNENEADDNLSNEQNSENIDLTSAQNNILTDNEKSVAKNNDKSEPISLRNVTHKVKKGERMQTIAKRYGVSVKQIMVSNSLKNSRVNTGQLLTIKTIIVNNSVAKKTTKIADSNKAKKKTYTVQQGDTLHSIAQKFDVAITDIKRWNRNVTANIQPGHKLTIRPSDAA